jgi:diguanylate cyclase (GGDEF)-like protein
VFTVTIAGLFALQAREAKVRADRRVGISIDQSAAGLEVIAVEEGLPAERAGISVGDTFVAIEGHPVERAIDYEVAAQVLARGDPATYEMLREGEPVAFEVSPGTEFPVVDFALGTLALFGYLGLALLALFQGVRDVRARVLFLFAAAVALELALPYEAIGNPTLSTLSLALFYLLTGLEMSAELHLASVIPRPYGWVERRPWLVWGYYLVGLGLGAVTAVTYLTETLVRRIFPWSVLQIDNLLLDVVLPLWALAVPAILVQQMLRAHDPRGRQQAGLVLIGVVPWTVNILLQKVFELQGVNMPIWMDAFETLTLLAYPLAVFVAIYRYQLFDIELVARRGLAYTVLTGLLILAFYATLGAGGALFSNLVAGGRSVWFVASVTLALGLLFSPLRRFLQGLIDRRFFPERDALRQRLVALASELPGFGKLPLMGSHLVERLEAIFAVRSAALLLVDPGSGALLELASSGRKEEAEGPIFLVPRSDPAVEALAKAGRPLALSAVAEKGGTLGARLRGLDATWAVPLMVQGELIGVMAVGPKDTGDRFPGEELELLNLLAHHVAIVFQNARLFESATYESLTGLLRREAILEILDRELERAERYDRPLTVGMADLDHFKEINDRYGHLAGDTLLKQVAEGMAGGLRSTDSLGRYGGEEFLMVLPETDLAGARVVADKLRRLVAEVEAPMADGETASVTVSIGLAGREGSEHEGAAVARELIERADRALYRAKKEGRNRIHPPMIARVS